MFEKEISVNILTFNNMCELIINIIGTIAGGLLLTIILFILNEYVFRKKNLTGEWKIICKVKKSSMSRYENLKIEYTIHLIQKGNELYGSGEKIKDINQDGSETIFEREKRVINEIEGFYERKYLGKSKVYLNINEQGRKRETRSTYFLTFKGKNKLIGYFQSTAADATGKIEMTKS